MSDKKAGIGPAELGRRLIWLLFAAIIGYLLVASIFSTCYLGSYSYATASGDMEVNVEHTFYIRDHWAVHIAAFALLSLLLVSVRPDRIRRLWNGRYTGVCICAAVGVLAVAVVLAGQYYPKFDQRHVVEAAARLNQHIYSDFDRGDYLFVFPFQMGTVLYFRLLSLIFGNGNHIAFQLVNCLWIAMTYYLFMKIAGLLWGGEQRRGRLCQIGTACMGILFVPYLLYATFLYGTVVGMAFALLSFYMMLRYEQRPTVCRLLLGGLSMGIATVVKSNYVIFMIAQFVYLLLKCLAGHKEGRKKLLSRLVMAAALLLFFWAGRLGVDACIRSASGQERVEGIPMTAWIAMGLQDGKAAPGWYNGYNNGVYIENDYDYEKTSAAVRTEIMRILAGYPKDLSTTVSFFVKKISSQWNNPTFQSLWVIDGRDGAGGLSWLLHGTGRYLFIFWANLLQTWVLAGTFLYALHRFKKSGMAEILLPVTFVGGFLFHIFWEAEGLYSILYFPLLLPLGVCGLAEWRSCLLSLKAEIASAGWQSAEGGRWKKRLAVGAMAAVIVCALSYTDPFAKLFARNENTGAFDPYTQETVNEHDALPGGN